MPLFTPPMTHLRAGAVWVTIANWADALAARYGDARVVTSQEHMGADLVRSRASWGSGGGAGAEKRYRLPHVRTLVKDLRWGAWSAFDAIHASRADLSPFEDAPYVWQHHDLFASNGFVAASRLGLPTVLFVDAPQVWEAKRWGVNRPGWGRILEFAGEQHQLSRADLVACVTDEVANQVLAITDGKARVLVTPCTAEIPTLSLREQTRAELGLEGRVVLGWVGSFRPFHNVSMLIRAAKDLTESHEGLTLLLIGDGPTRARCEELATTLGVDCRFTGAVPNADVLGLLQGCDIGVLPSGTGGDFHYSPLKVKEYMAAGLPVVLPRVGEMGRTMTHGEDALLYEPGSESDLTIALKQLLYDRPLRNRLARAATELLRSSFTLGEQLRRIEENLGVS